MSATTMLCCGIMAGVLLAAAATGPGSKPDPSGTGEGSLPVYDPKTGHVPSPCYAIHTPSLPMRDVTGTPHHIGMKTDAASDRLGLEGMPISFDTQRYAPGGYQEPQGHPERWQFLYVVEGEGEFRIGDAIYKISPGSCCFIPSGVVHAARNTGKGDLVMLFVGGTGDLSAKQ